MLNKGNKDSPRVSVLIPTYNYARYLDEAIQSAIRQTFTDFEIIIVDNNSTDNTAEVVSKYLTDPRIRYYRNKSNIGLINNFNRCLELATGQYIKFLLADDVLNPTILEKFVQILDDNETVALVTSDSESFGSEKSLRKSPFAGLQKGSYVIEESIRGGRGNMIGEPTTVMFRSANVDKVGKFSANFICLADLDYWCRHLTIGDCYFVPETLSYFRVHDMQVSFLQNYANWFDEYAFYKRVQQYNDYKVPAESLNVAKTVKKTALKSAGAIYPLLPQLHKKQKRKMLAEALKIAFREQVLLSSLFIHITKKKKKAFQPS